MNSKSYANARQKMDDVGIIFGALGNLPKRAILYHIGIKGKCRGGAEELVMPIVQNMKGCGYELNPFSIPPKLSELRNKDGLVEKDSDDFWRLSERGKKAFGYIEWMLKSEPGSEKCKIAIKEWCPILDAIGNSIKRIIIMYLGKKVKCKGGSADFIIPIVGLSEKFGTKINPFSLPPKLSELKNKDGLVEQDKNSCWNLSKSGKMAYSLLAHVAEKNLEKEMLEMKMHPR